MFSKNPDLKTALEIIKIHPKNIEEGKQGKHILGHSNYINGKSYVTLEIKDIKELVEEHAGKGLIDYDPKSGRIREIATAESKIGVAIDKIDSSEHETKSFKIHYSKKGVHIVPRKEDKK